MLQSCAIGCKCLVLPFKCRNFSGMRLDLWFVFICTTEFRLCYHIISHEFRIFLFSYLLIFVLSRSYRDCTLFLFSSCVGRNCLSNNWEIHPARGTARSNNSEDIDRERGHFLTLFCLSLWLSTLKPVGFMEAILWVIYWKPQILFHKGLWWCFIVYFMMIFVHLGVFCFTMLIDMNSQETYG